MTRQFLALTAVASLALAGCAKDPTATLSGTPTLISISDATLNVTVGDSILVTARTLDAQGVVLPTVPTAVSESANVVVVDVTEPPLSQARFYVKGVAIDTAVVRVTVGGISDSIVVFVN